MTVGVGSSIDEDYSDEADRDFPVSVGDDVVVIDGAFTPEIGYIGSSNLMFCWLKGSTASPFQVTVTRQWSPATDY